MLATHKGEQLQPSFSSGASLCRHSDKKRVSLFIYYFSDTIERKRPDFESLPDFKDKQKVTSVACSVNF